ncbi:TonB-dependent receptor domain-containing protein [Polymorphobacter multimanifer]|uniref:TonB-dependent receptor domain-containing protein n=1 Tax=Polymorphobacter multimanifer TaxID=1070431 RepID=UPI0016678633|nr:TonB-dependent receptor [Polymorphobacter multimanifer]
MAKIDTQMAGHARSGRVLLASTALAALLALPQAAQAQTPTPSTETAAVAEAAQDGSEIIVTGTSIRGVAPTGSALIGVTRDTIQANAPANASELLSQVPQLGNFGANHEQATVGRFRTGGFLPNIHNIGIFATLTLFNGHRMAAVGGEAVLPDPGIVPILAVQRVEIVADGSSAVYGSDAVAGVANFIYRRDMEGFEAQGTYGFSENSSYEKRNLALGWGKRWSSGNFMIVGEYSGNTPPTNGEYDFIRADQRFRGGADRRGTSCSLPNVTANGVVYAYPSFLTGNANRNRCENQLENTIIPDSRRYSVLATIREQISDTVTLWAEGNYSNLRTSSIANPRNFNLIVPNTNPYFVLPPGVTASQVAVVRNTQGLFDNPRNLQRSEVMGITLGADIDVGGDWQINLLTHYSKTNDYNDQPEVDLQVAQALARGTTRATAFNPFGQAADNNADVLAQINNGFTQINDTSQYLRQLQVKADGPLFAVPGGDVRVAVGTDFRDEQANQLQLGGVPGPNQLLVRDDNISRFVAAVFTEVNIPLFSGANAIPLFQRLDLAVSGRYDHYQGLGGTFNPKFGIVWQPIEDLTLRGSWGTSFVAPNLGLITSIFGVPQPGQNVAGIGTVNIYNQGGGNPALTPEDATTYSFGAELRPTFIPNLRFGVTYYNVKYSNLVYKPTQADAFFNPAFAYALTRNPTPAQVAQAIAEAPPQSPVPDVIDFIFRSYAVNLGSRSIDGLDFDLNYTLDTGIGNFLFNINANRQLGYRQEIVPGSGFQDLVGRQEAIKWRARGQLSWTLEDFTASLFMNYIDSYTNPGSVAFPEVDSWETFDLTLQYNMPQVLKGSQIQFRASNLFDRSPPFYDGTLGYFSNLASPFGRTLEVTLRTRF